MTNTELNPPPPPDPNAQQDQNTNNQDDQKGGLLNKPLLNFGKESK